MGFLKRFLDRATESDEDRLRGEIHDWASSIEGATPVGEAPSRQRVQIAGVVRRITVWPREGTEPEYMEVVLDDGTGQVSASWTGRRSIPGMALGTRLLVEGVLRDDRDQRVMDNPKYEFAT